MIQYKRVKEFQVEQIRRLFESVNQIQQSTRMIRQLLLIVGMIYLCYQERYHVLVIHDYRVVRQKHKLIMIML